MEFLKQERIRKAEEEKHREEAAQRREKLKALKSAEQAKVNELREEVSGWKEAQEIRAYIAVARTTLAANDESAAAWLAWAEKYADHIDPLTDARIEILDMAC